MDLSYSERKQKWIIGDDAIIPYKMPPDGLIILFYTKDVKDVLDKNYPHNDKVWWFNETKDREIAECHGEFTSCNPQVLWKYFLKGEYV